MTRKIKHFRGLDASLKSSHVGVRSSVFDINHGLADVKWHRLMASRHVMNHERLDAPSNPPWHRGMSFYMSRLRQRYRNCSLDVFIGVGSYYHRFHFSVYDNDQWFPLLDIYIAKRVTQNIHPRLGSV